MKYEDERLEGMKRWENLRRDYLQRSSFVPYIPTAPFFDSKGTDDSSPNREWFGFLFMWMVSCVSFLGGLVLFAWCLFKLLA